RSRKDSGSTGSRRTKRKRQKGSIAAGRARRNATRERGFSSYVIVPCFLGTKSRSMAEEPGCSRFGGFGQAVSHASRVWEKQAGSLPPDEPSFLVYPFAFACPIWHACG